MYITCKCVRRPRVADPCSVRFGCESASHSWSRDIVLSVANCVEMPTAVLDFFFHGVTAPSGSGPPHCQGFTITLRHTTLGRTPLDGWSARRRGLYLTTHNTQKRQTSMPPAAFGPTIPASERPQTHALDRAATGFGSCLWLYLLV
jgi:hypothetical protein